MNMENLCRLCSSLSNTIFNAGLSPLANNFIKNNNEKYYEYELILNFCKKCYNIQLQKTISPNILYSNYTYITPEAKILSDHYSDIIEFLTTKKYINKNSSVLEIGSNVGFFLQSIKNHVRNILGVEPAKNISKLANHNDIETITEFFNSTTSIKIKNKYGTKNLIVARHMFAHNPDPHDIIKGINNLLVDEGILFIENAYAISTFINGEIDQIYHEHMYYYSVLSIDNLLNKYSMELVDLKESKVHGGTICFVAARKNKYKIESIINKYKIREKELFNDLYLFNKFIIKTNKLKENVLKVLNDDKKNNRRIAAYGASAKAFTMFSFLKIDDKIIDYCIDTTPTKIGNFFPKFNIKIISELDHLSNPADTFLITSWNYKSHIIDKKDKLFKKGDRLVFPLPFFEIINI